VTRSPAWLAPALIGAAAVVASRPAHAQAQVQTDITADVVEENEPAQVQMRVTLQGDEPPENPRLPAPAGVRVGPPNLSNSSRISIINGRMMQSTALTATWTVIAPKPGKYRLGPPSIEIGGKRVSGEARTLEVVPSGTLRRRPRGIPGQPPSDPFDLFDMFRNFPNFPGMPPFPLDDPLERDAPPAYPQELAVERALDPVAFVVAKATPTRVVVGQAVRFRVYAYGGRGTYQIQTANEPSRAGFIAYPENTEPAGYAVPIGGQTFVASRVSSLVLFPIQAGTLRIGSARLGISGRNYRPTPPATLLERESAPIDIIVTEPPREGRPPGYRVGDVGQFRLSAAVDPPKVRQGESVSVVAKLEGTGNPPTKLDLPLQTGVEWAEPTSTEKIEAIDGNVRGERVFSYIVRVDRAGKVDLGELTLPFYDADARRYSVARAALGSVEVAPNPAAVKEREAKRAVDDRLRGVLEPTRTLGPLSPPRTFLTDLRAFWLVLALGPLGVLTANGLRKLGTRLMASAEKRRNTPVEQALREIGSAKTAAARGDDSATTSAAERAIHLAIEAGTGIKSRGVLRSELSQTLSARGMSGELAKEAAALLEAIEHARFVRASATDSAELAKRAEAFVRAALSGRRS
jgi:hypothetical protein